MPGTRKVVSRYMRSGRVIDRLDQSDVGIDERETPLQLQSSRTHVEVTSLQ